MSRKSSRKPPSIPDRETRERQKLRRLGSETPACSLCGFSDWRALQLHHTAGQAYEDLRNILCANCHCIMSDLQNDHTVRNDNPPTMFDRIGRLLVNLADFFGQLADKLKAFGDYLLHYARTLEDGAAQ
jgi:hypothetical protein